MQSIPSFKQGQVTLSNGSASFFDSSMPDTATFALSSPGSQFTAPLQVFADGASVFRIQSSDPSDARVVNWSAFY